MSDLLKNNEMATTCILNCWVCVTRNPDTKDYEFSIWFVFAKLVALAM